jgi:cyanophycinase
MLGPLALVGSGEFLAEMEPIDRALLAAAGRTTGYALIVPTASALEPGMPAEWADRGIRHFRDRLGIEAKAALIMDRAEADGRFVPLVHGARLVYFSGGNPRYLTETMAGTPFWSAVAGAWRDGAVLAGCSAGAMMLGQTIQNIVGRPGGWVDGLGVLPGMAVIPHFDRIEHYRPGALAAVRGQRQPAITLLGIDELTALLWLDDVWSVEGAGSVLVISDEGEQRYGSGASVALPAPLVPAG